VRLAIDDFGAGYSNLVTLARLPFDTVKLDRSMISNVATDPEKQTIVRIGLKLAAELGFETVVEGIENMQDLEFVADAGATYAQGYLFSEAVPFAEITAMLQPGEMTAITLHAWGNDRLRRLGLPPRQHPPRVAGKPRKRTSA